MRSSVTESRRRRRFLRSAELVRRKNGVLSFSFSLLVLVVVVCFQKLFFLLLIPKIVRFFFGRDMHFFSLESNRPHFSFDSGTVRAFVRPLVESKVNLLSLFFLTGGVPF